MAKEIDKDELNAVNAIRFFIDSYNGELEDDYAGKPDETDWGRMLPFLEGAVTRREMANRLMKAAKDEDAARNFTDALRPLKAYWTERRGGDDRDIDFEKVFVPELLEPTNDDPATMDIKDVTEFAGRLAKYLGYKEQQGKEGVTTAEEQMHADRKDDVGAVVGKDGSLYDRFYFDGDLGAAGGRLFYGSKGWGPALGRRVRAAYDFRDEDGDWHDDDVVQESSEFRDFKRAMGFSRTATVEDVEDYVNKIMQPAHKAYEKARFAKEHPVANAVYEFFFPAQAESLENGRTPDVADAVADAASLAVGLIPIGGTAAKAAQGAKAAGKAAKAASIAEKALEVGKDAGRGAGSAMVKAVPIALAQELVDLGHDLAEEGLRDPELYVRDGDPRSMTGYKVDFPEMTEWKEDKDADSRIGEIANPGGRLAETAVATMLLGGAGAGAGGLGGVTRLIRPARAIDDAIGNATTTGLIAKKQTADKATELAEKARRKSDKAEYFADLAEREEKKARKELAKAPKEKRAEKEAQLKRATRRTKNLREIEENRFLNLGDAIKAMQDANRDYEHGKALSGGGLGSLLAEHVSPRMLDKVMRNYDGAVRVGRSQLVNPNSALPVRAILDAMTGAANRKTGRSKEDD